ncbi:hypothetical protein SAMN04489812_0552 [Microlunatus soli]|uniref:Uncharacterized protein n=2 Tax=Microlunatus soli TaxID=630515 RepID=A0A1H1NKN5_9ACTN|nr:hypothetical protein SAMN04489812_0552 [Microlunatus soli]
MTCLLWAIVIGGVIATALVTGFQVMFPCADFTDSQSGDGGNPGWRLFPPGPECRTTVALVDGTTGTHIDSPSWFRVVALICWLGWIATIVWARRRANGARTDRPVA